MATGAPSAGNSNACGGERRRSATADASPARFSSTEATTRTTSSINPILGSAGRARVATTLIAAVWSCKRDGPAGDRRELKVNTMRIAHRCLQTSGLVIFAPIFVSASNRSDAATVTLKCDAPLEMTLVYEGDDDGTLTVTESWGAFSLPAKMETREGEIDGEIMKTTGILANGSVTSKMPDKASIEACVKSKLSGELIKDSDVVSVTALGCSASAPLGKETVKVNANVEISIVSAPPRKSRVRSGPDFCSLQPKTPGVDRPHFVASRHVSPSHRRALSRHSLCLQTNELSP